jgi:hypothetical protein
MPADGISDYGARTAESPTHNATLWLVLYWKPAQVLPKIMYSLKYVANVESKVGV